MSNERKWVFVALDGADFKLNVLPSTVNAVRDGQGNILMMKKMPPVNIIFNNGKAVIEDSMAKRVSHSLQTTITPEKIVEWIEAQAGFGNSFICIQSPDKSMTAEELAKLKEVETARSKGPKIIQGARGIRN